MGTRALQPEGRQILPLYGTPPSVRVFRLARLHALLPGRHGLSITLTTGSGRERRAVLVPHPVGALQGVPEEHLLRGEEAQRRVVELELLVAGSDAGALFEGRRDRGRS